MNNLLKANFYKLAKERSIVVLSIVTAVFSLIGILLYKLLGNFSSGGVNVSDIANAKNLFLAGAQLSQNAGTLMALGIAIYIGKEFSQNTVRNKIAIGYSKRAVYLSNLIMSAVIGMIIYLVYELIVFALGLPLLGWGGDFVAGEFIRQLINSLCIVITASAAVNLIAMLTRNLVAAIVISMIGIIAIPAILMGVYMMPLKSGVKTVVEIVMKSNFLGQTVLIATENSVSFMVWVVVSSVVITALTAVLGSWQFEKMDIK